MTLFVTHKCLAMAIFYFIYLFLNFKPFNSKLNYIKYENKIFFQMGWIFILLEVQGSPKHLPISCIIMHWRGNQISFKIWFLFEKYWMLQIKSFPFLFPLSIASINTQHCVQAITRDPNPYNHPNFGKNFQESSKFEFLFSASFSQSQPSILAQEVPSNWSILLLRAKAPRIVLYITSDLVFFHEIEFIIPCIANDCCVFIWIQDDD